MADNQEKMHKVAFTAFRNELANYLEKIANGEEITVMDAKRGRVIAILKGAEKSSK
jgi:antitoxin (DNA-binding transcriptional repressor) of toxin-antitoxin stability system